MYLYIFIKGIWDGGGKIPHSGIVLCTIEGFVIGINPIINQFEINFCKVLTNLFSQTFIDNFSNINSRGR